MDDHRGQKSKRMKQRSGVWAALLVAAGCLTAKAQQPQTGIMKTSTERRAVSGSAGKWADSVLKELSPEERIAQLIFVRAFSNKGADHIRAVERLVRDWKVGGLVFFQGGPVRQAALTNHYQAISKVPLFISIDGEWGLGMRLDSVVDFPPQLLMGALQDSSLVYAVGEAIGEQCRRIGVQINFAPVVDVNNNPDNPVINDRSFGEDKYRVAHLGIAYMKGMQSTGVLACAKHFPGHGDTNVDSHKALPEIDKSMAQLRSLELYPFQEMINAGVASIMVAHLQIPAIEKRSHRPTSLSAAAINRLLRHDMGFNGLVFTDALEMKGVADYFPDGSAVVEALIAGDDICLLPEDVGDCITKVKAAIAQRRLSWSTINAKVRKVLVAKYNAGLGNWQPIETAGLAEDLNRQTMALNRELYVNALTVLKNENYLLPFRTGDTLQAAVLDIGGQDAFVRALQHYRPMDRFSFSDNDSPTDAAALATRLKKNYDKLIIAVGGYNRYPARHFGLSETVLQLLQQLQEEMPTVTVAFGNPYAMKYFCHGPAMVAAYTGDTLMQQVAADLLFGAFDPSGKLPVTVCPELSYGMGLHDFSYTRAYLPYVLPSTLQVNERYLRQADSIARDGIARGAYPGCEILAMRHGKIFYHKAFGHLSYDKKIPVDRNTIYDMASCTKICATTISCMQLYDQGKLALNGTLGQYLPFLRGSDKAGLSVRDIMLHQAGFVAWIPFYRETLTDKVHPSQAIYRNIRDSQFSVRVAEDMYMRRDYLDTMFAEIRNSRLGRRHNYIYSDNDFILMGRVVEQLSGLPLDAYVKRHFYDPIGLLSTGFHPRERYPLNRIAPTECEAYFRLQCLHGDVHDPGAAMFGGVAGHAGLFSDAYDLAALMQMLLNGGTFAGVRYLDSATIRLFTSYQSDISRRGIGWDKPEPDRSKFSYSYPSKYCSPETFGHTGYTGTCVWVDPKYDFVYIFLSNRVNPDGGTNLKLSHLEIRGKIQDAFYLAMGVVDKP